MTLTDAWARPAELGVAKRVTLNEARAHFVQGGEVLVSEHGHELERSVFAHTTTHKGGTADAWETLAASVRTWRNRYPNQRYYVVTRHEVMPS